MNGTVLTCRVCTILLELNEQDMCSRVFYNGKGGKATTVLRIH